MMLERIVELGTFGTILFAAITHLNRACSPPWYDRLSFAGVAAGACWTAFDPLGLPLLLAGLAVVFVRHFALERREVRKPPAS